MELAIKNFNQITTKIRLDVGQVTLVTGTNGIGKSTVAKLLYCLLKSNCELRYEPAITTINYHIEDFFKILNRYEEININSLVDIDDEYQILEEYTTLRDKITQENTHIYKKYEEKFKLIDSLIKMLQDNSTQLHISLLRTLLIKMFTKELKGEIILTPNKNKKEEYYKINLNDYDLYDDKILDYIKGPIFEQVYYIDNSGTILDYIDYNGTFNNENIKYINEKINVDKKTLFDETNNKQLIELEEELVNIIGGKFEYDYNNNLLFKSLNGEEFNLKLVSSGIRNLGVLYLLLHNRQINKNTFIIIDEIENNLHSNVKVKLAEWLCKLSKYCGVHLYINSKSPMFLEAMEVYSVKHKLDDYVEYNLLKYNNSGEVSCNNLKRHNLFLLYDNLGDAYDIIDEQRVRNIFG